MYTCTRCGHVSVWEQGTNGHSYHCGGFFVTDPGDDAAVQAAYRFGGAQAARAMVDHLNTERDALPGVSGSAGWGF